MLVSGSKSDRGLLRENNEDSFYVNDKLGVYVLADGMGGHDGGEIASNIVVETLGKNISLSLQHQQEDDIEHIVNKALYEANEEIILLKKEHIELTNMGTTVVLSVFFDDIAYYSHLGDSRAYLYNKEDKLLQLTTDDSLVMEMVKRGKLRKDQLRTHHLRNIVTRYLGTNDLALHDIRHCDFGKGDCILLCSDGLTSMIDERDILAILHASIPMGPQYACDRLVYEANNNGGHDNITVIVIQNK
ncbi:MAG: Stp1/IreP family PP2C-type Ser/Thr phosphatase [Nitrososphaeraceae archaeon]